MDKKKALLVVIIAAILAFGVAVIFKQDKKVELPQNQQEQESVLNKEEQETTEIIEETEESEKTEEKNLPTKQVPIKPEVKSSTPTAEYPVIEPLQVTEPLEGAILEETIDHGIMKETETGNIIITREFKSKSKDKYIFEGFGIQVAPTK